MIYTQKIQDLLNRAKDFTGMSLTDFYAENDKLVLKAKKLVEERITGERKGLPGELNRSHSFRGNKMIL